ncbi:MAG: ribonuclease HI [Clostridia bacterium]|nr:ribonuclease HI [Clostridia bacterium]
MKKVTIYTDGACSGNPGPGGWGALLMFEGNKKEISGAKTDTTNNIMELTAVIEALKLLKVECEVDLYSDSSYVVNAFLQGWIFNWRKNNWKTASKEPVKNRELWEELYSLTQKHKVNFIKVKGHSDNEFNNRCDYLATSAIKELL